MKASLRFSALPALLIVAGCGDVKVESSPSQEVIYSEPLVDETFRALYTRSVGYQVFDGTTSKPVRRLETGDLHGPPYPDWEKPTFDDPRLAKIAGLLERLISEHAGARLSLIERAFFARDLWMAFDEMTGRGAAYERVQRLLARGIREFAPTQSELEGIPAPPRPPPVPADLGDASAGWAELSSGRDHHVEGPQVPAHALAARGHSYFRIHMKFDQGQAGEHVKRLIKGDEIDLPRGITVVLVEYGNFISRELTVVPTELLLKFQTRRIDDPANDVGDVAEFRYRRRKIFAGWRDGGLDRTDPEAEGFTTLSMSNPVIHGNTLGKPLKNRCGDCHNPQAWTTNVETQSRRFGSIRSLIPRGAEGLGSRDLQIRASRAVLDHFGNLKRLEKYARR